MERPTYVVKTCDFTGEQVTGCALQFARLIGNKNMEEVAVSWPADGSKERRKMHEYAIAMALLMGMEPCEFGGPGSGKWFADGMTVSVGYHKSQGELACAYINVKGFWVVLNAKGEWECVRV